MKFQVIAGHYKFSTSSTQKATAMSSHTNSSIPTSGYDVYRDDCPRHQKMRCLCIREINQDQIMEPVPTSFVGDYTNRSFITFNPNKPDSTIWEESYYAELGIGSRRGSAWRKSNCFEEKSYTMISDKKQEIYFTKQCFSFGFSRHVSAPHWALNDNRSGNEEGWKVICNAPRNLMAITNKTNYIVKIVFDSQQELVDSGLLFKSQEIFPGKSIIINSPE